MGVEASTYVWQQSKQKGSKLVVMLALADYASNETGECFPGITALAEKCRMQVRNLRYVLSELEKGGEIKRIHGEGQQTNTGSTNRYILCGFVAWLKQVKAIKDDKQGVQAAAPPKTEGVQSSVSRGAIQRTQGVQATAPKPSLEPSLEPSRVTAAATKGPEIIEAYKRAHDKKAPPVITDYDRKNAVKVIEAGYTSAEVEGLTREKLKDKDSYPFSWLVSDLPGYRVKATPKPYRTMSPAEPDDPDRVELSKPEAAKLMAEMKAKIEREREDKPA